MFQWWHANGTKQTQGQYKDGLKTGLWAWWHTNGRVAIKGEFDNGIERGEWTWFNDSGRVDDVRDFSRSASDRSTESFDRSPDDPEDIGIGVPDEEGSPGDEPDDVANVESEDG